MTKREFLIALKACLSGLPKEEIEQQINYYTEMIDDRMEEGLSEEEAVGQIGDLEEIIDQLPKPEKKKRRLKTWELVLLIVGFPVWLPLLIAAVAVAGSLYVSWWAILISLWAAFGSLAACGFAGVVFGIGFCFESLSGPALIGAGLFCAGLAVFSFFGCKWLTDSTLKLTKKVFTCKKEGAK